LEKRLGKTPWKNALEKRPEKTPWKNALRKRPEKTAWKIPGLRGLVRGAAPQTASTTAIAVRAAQTAAPTTRQFAAHRKYPNHRICGDILKGQ
jgi:hypothetical protein